jgi:TatD DNase family protein
MNYWIDTHAHIYQPKFDEDIHEVIQRCLDANVQKVILPNIDIESLKRVQDLAHKFPLMCLAYSGFTSL